MVALSHTYYAFLYALTFLLGVIINESILNLVTLFHVSNFLHRTEEMIGTITWYQIDN